MSEQDLLATARANRGNGGGKVKWTLDQVVALIIMKGLSKPIKEIELVTGHSEHSIGYKFRWTGKFENMAGIYNHFGEKFVDNKEAQLRADKLIKGVVKKTA